ncbi:unnamed protein product [Withania somnifera]
MENVEKATSHVNVSTQCSFPSNHEDFVGFKEDVERIIQKLTGGTKERDVISIVGMAGLGNTTLARKVYSSHSISGHFDVRAFCTISQTYSLLAEIPKQATGDKRDIKEDENVADLLRRALVGKRYLIVLDDIWKYKAWEDLHLSFPREVKGSRIMVTTRDEEEMSWELLQKKVFKCETCPFELQKEGFEVARNCKGLPLVIVLNAGIIAQKERKVSVWQEFAKDLSSLGLEEQSMKAVQSSYDYLGDHLKHCLLYIGYFPEDYSIPVSDLLKLWIAEEFVPNIGTENLEKSSKDCLSDLVNRSLVMVSKRRSNGDIKYCTVHDLVREFYSNKLKEDEFKQHVVPHNSSKPSYAKDPRLCMYIHDKLVNQLELHGYSLDEISFVGSEEKESLELIAHPQFYSSRCMDLFSLLTKLKLIRVLHLLDVNMESAWKFQTSPASILRELKHLKYLAIFVKRFDFKWVSHMVDLQTLRVHSHDRIKTSPDVWKIKKLRHVDISEFSFIWEDNEQEESSQSVLENLMTFGKCRVTVADMNRKFWWRFPNVEELRLSIVNFHGMGNHSLFPTPEIHNRLESLEISFPIGFLRSIGWFKSVFPLNLKVLSLAGISLTEEIVSSIAALQKLETLKLFFVHFSYNPQWDLTDQEFKAMKYLKLELVDMNKWECSETSFPVLEKLVIKDCDQLEEIPSSFSDIETLRLIKLINCSKSVRNSAQRIKEEVECNQRYERLQLQIPRNY